jgi:hypothetical protein
VRVLFEPWWGVGAVHGGGEVWVAEVGGRRGRERGRRGGKGHKRMWSRLRWDGAEAAVQIGFPRYNCDFSLLLSAT